jgi:hypothetical protein
VSRPDFIIGGAPRSGTTALARALDDHPDITVAKPLIPEPKVLLVSDDPHATYAALFAEAPTGHTLGEKTSNLFEDPDVPERVARLLPDVRMVFTLRQPAERAYSNWLWSRLNGLESLPVAEAIAQEPTRTVPPGLRPGARPFAYVERSRYGKHASRWIEALGRERLHFVLFEELTGSRAGAAFADLQTFLGVTHASLRSLPRDSGNEAAGSGPALEPADRARVAELLDDDPERFAELTGVDIGAWAR